MAKRDPNKTARNKAIEQMKQGLRELLPSTLPEIDRYDNELSLNAFIGSKAEKFLDLKNEVIKSPEEYVSKWLYGLSKCLENGEQGTIIDMHDYLRDPSKVHFRKYCELFLRRSFLNHYEELSKTRPREDESYYWFGLNDAQHGLFVTPRFNINNSEWENDKSEIRAFSETYWTIGHVLKTGLCYQGEDRIYPFRDIEAYLNFFYDQVRLTKSQYQIEIADKYIEFVRSSLQPEKIPLLLPEIRFNSLKIRHEHRLDFLVINPYTMDKIGFELSPWSTHGQLTLKSKNDNKVKTSKEVNTEALQNFEKETNKMKDFFKKHNIYTLIFTESDLKDMNNVFDEIKKFLHPMEPPVQLSLNLIDEYFGI
jgi:hypothetical protein